VSLAVTGAWLDGESVSLRAEDGQIAELGPDVSPGPGDETIDGRGLALLPGLVNGHTHAAMALFRGQGDDLPLMEWLEKKVWPVEARLDAEDVYWGTRLACAEMIRSGTIRFWDMYWQPAAIARAVEDSGLRATLGAPLFDGDDPDRGSELRAAAERSLEEIGEPREQISQSLAPHAVYTVSEASLRWIAEFAAGRELPIQIHLSETRDEVERCVAAHGERPAAYLDSVGLLGPRALLAHGVWLDDAELDLIAERGATLVTNPVANLKLAVGGAFRYAAARDRGIPLGLGTDGAGSNNSLDLFADMKVFALLQKHVSGDAATATATEVWQLATGRLSSLLGGGSLAVGEPADFLLARASSPELSLGDFTAGLVYAASGDIVDTTVVAGRVLMRGGVVAGEREILERAVERAQRLGLEARPPA
jgi:5-methylthioadenosine/S-adenosylhomocysteine deaminase